MNIYIYDKDYQLVDIIDKYISFIWTERYSSVGDFEIYSFVTDQLLKYAAVDLAKDDYYVMIRQSDRAMIIEKVEILTNVSDGNKIKITGRSIEAILERRSIFNQKTYEDAALTDVLSWIMSSNVTGAGIGNRRIPNISYITPSDSSITSIQDVSNEYNGDIVLEAIRALCESYNLGFKMEVNSNFGFEFTVFKGKDRSFDQNVNPYVTFSSKMENLISTDCIRSINTFRNVALVIGDGGFKTTYQADESVSGMNRREVFIDLSDVSRTDENNETIPANRYEKILKQKAKEKLSEYSTKTTEAFSAEIDTNKGFKYGVDYSIGDVVQIVNEYGMESKVRVSEYVITDEASGFNCYPTFTAVDEEE